MNIIGVIIAIIALFLIIKVTKTVFRIIFTFVSIFGILYSIYGNQIFDMVMNLIQK